ncbi:DHHC zinc finger domain containing protein [Histomonas meleagridis]|uniref:DHHC zinc finger domain containing protein n=1 Tax=Histomonas meleagridis TaxID=135588 RepID=UPI0035599D72|nr:DHHC zinc finger domain containing protein [Histomonas meleagridis]KAH0798948.1 DHHC zinc finger domain containing protein [Histomonas meleagridis]
MINYTLTHFVNPGIIPWNWSETRRTRYSSNEIKSGIATTPEQKQWGKDHELPPRAFFSYSYGFAVLRAEHICFFADQWVGIHNLKYFLLATMYGSIYLIYVFITSYIAYHEDPTFSFKKLWLYLLAFCTTGLFASYHIQQLVLGVKRIVENYTYVESRFGFPNVYNRGVIKNFEEIFGPVFLLPLWFLPIPLKGTKNGYDYPQPPAEILENNDDVSLQNKVI